MAFIRHPGSSLGEYGFLFALVAIAVIVGLSLFGVNARNLMTGNAGQVTVTIVPGMDGSGGSGSEPADPPQPGFGPLRLTTSRGTSVVLPQMPTDLSTSLQTAGANGTTDMLAAQILAMADQLLAAGEIDQAQANDFRKLAQQMKDIAKVQKQFEDIDQAMFKKYGDYLQGRTNLSWGDVAGGKAMKARDEFMNAFGKGPSPMQDAMMEIGSSWNTSTTTFTQNDSYDFFVPDVDINEPYQDRFGIFRDPSRPLTEGAVPGEISPKTQAMLDTFDRLERSGTLRDASVKGVVLTSVQEVIAISDGVNRAAWQVQSLAQPVGKLTEQAASAVSFYDADRICSLPGARCG